MTQLPLNREWLNRPLTITEADAQRVEQWNKLMSKQMANWLQTTKDNIAGWDKADQEELYQ